ncbi:hypothetical protein ACHAXN_010715 [Cyclotella atomus]
MKALPFILFLATALMVAGDVGEVCHGDSQDASCSVDSNQEVFTVQEPVKQKQFICKDLHENCQEWSKISFNNDEPDACRVNSAYMTQHCAMACDACDQFYLGFRLSEMVEGGLSITPFCQDENFDCRQLAAQGECENNPLYMNMFCEASCGICSEERFGVKQSMHKGDSAKRATVRHHCLNKNPDCTLWAAGGECDKNERYMKSMCAPACLSCDYLGDTSEDCPGLPECMPLWKPGDLNVFFETIVDNANGNGEYYRQFNPKALSRPKTKSDGSDGGVENDGAWLVLLDNFITDEEAERIIEIGHGQGFERSRKAVHSGEGRVTEGEHHLIHVARVLERIANTTNSTIHHSEHLQLVRYETGQFYVGHDDFIPYQLDLPCGARIMTIFLYLNDVEDGGGTRFTELDITVQPKRGTALLWPNVINEDPMESETRTFHEALPVIKGVKYGVNSWIHNEDFQTPWKNKCLGNISSTISTQTQATNNIQSF